MNCHLEAHVGRENSQKRFQQLNEIYHELFKQERGTIHQFYDMKQHDVKVIFGDLNFRLNSDIDFPKCVDMIQNGDIKELIKRDDLYIYGGGDPLIRNFMEGALLFAPTYKYLCGTNVYDKDRIPAWCDRVLWQAK